VEKAGELDVVLMDIQMPVLDGLSATRQLRARGISTPIIALTANTDEASRAAAIEAGMDDIVTKPVELATLKMTLERCLVPTFTKRRQSLID